MYETILYDIGIQALCLTKRVLCIYTAYIIMYDLIINIIFVI